MILGRTGQVVKEDFTVVDDADAPIPGIDTGEFTHKLYTPAGAESVLPVTYLELGSGSYRLSFTPDTAGVWYLIVYHGTYFPRGKIGTVEVYDSDFDTLGVDVTFIKDIEGGRWRIVGNQMIFFKEDGITEVARFNLFDESGTPTMDSVFERQRA